MPGVPSQGLADKLVVPVATLGDVDVPRLAVGVYATSISTPLFFTQAVGRFVRSRAKGENYEIGRASCRERV